MHPRKEHREQPGSLEAALREINSAPRPDDTVPDHAENPGELRPGEHTLASPRIFEAHAEEEPRPGYTLWGRCGYVPSSRLRAE
jgi:hypothetical protein